MILYINDKPSWHSSVHFSNLSNYFQAVTDSSYQNNIAFPVLTGDFFTYADRVDDYWYIPTENIYFSSL